MSEKPSAAAMPPGENFSGYSVYSDESGWLCSLGAFMEDWVRRYGASGSQPAAPPQPIEGDMFWDESDPEMSQDSPDEILMNSYSRGDIVEFQQATRHPNFFGFWYPQPQTDRDDDEQCYFFLTADEAEAKLAELQGAAAHQKQESPK